MRVKILFWNYNVDKGGLMADQPAKGDPLAWVVKEQGVDVIVLADCTLPNADILASLGSLGLEFRATLPHDKVRVFGRSSKLELDAVLSDTRVHLFRLACGGFEEILIGATHLYDRLNHQEERRRHDKVKLHYQTVVDAENRVGHNRTLLVGDFNMTPNEAGMIDPEQAFGALMTWDLAEVHSDPMQGGSPRFYNPMWSLMGRAEAPGTYFWESTDRYNIYWYCLDGVILRPALRGVFRDESLAIVTTLIDPGGREIPLIRRARKHWKIEFSDHLPITFELALRENESGANHG